MEWLGRVRTGRYMGWSPCMQAGRSSIVIYSTYSICVFNGIALPFLLLLSRKVNVCFVLWLHYLHITLSLTVGRCIQRKVRSRTKCQSVKEELTDGGKIPTGFLSPGARTEVGRRCTFTVGPRRCPNHQSSAFVAAAVQGLSSYSFIHSTLQVARCFIPSRHAPPKLSSERKHPYLLTGTFWASRLHIDCCISSRLSISVLRSIQPQHVLWQSGLSQKPSTILDRYIWWPWFILLLSSCSVPSSLAAHWHSLLEL